MGLGSRTQLSGRAIATDTPETGLCSGSGLFVTLGSTTGQAAPRKGAMGYLLDTAVTEACTGRAAIGTGKPARPATISQGGGAA
jgi:hypothetical protein